MESCTYNVPAVYDPAVAECGHDRMTDQMITQVNIHHDVVKIAHRIYCREANLKRRIDITENKLRRERSKAKAKARKHGVAYSAVLAVSAWFAHVAMAGGLTNINFALPLALASSALLSWTACGWWHDEKKKRRLS